MRRLGLVPAMLTGAAAATIAILLFALASDAMQPRHLLASPIVPAVAGANLLALPIYAVLRPWLGLRLGRYLLCATALSLGLGLYHASQWNMNPPINARTLAWIVGFPAIAVLSFRAVMRGIGPLQH